MALGPNLETGRFPKCSLMSRRIGLVSPRLELTLAPFAVTVLAVPPKVQNHLLYRHVRRATQLCRSHESLISRSYSALNLSEPCKPR